jgi:putative ABC transport system substrate-binding protein
MKKKITVLALCAVLLALCGSVHAQQAGKVLRIGFLERSTASGTEGLLTAFRQELSKLGWVEGKDVTFEFRFADQIRERLPDLATALVRTKIDVIVAGGSGPTSAAKQATGTIPIVMAQDADPVGNGFVSSLARPGGNITGLSALSTGLNTKRLEILKDALPRLNRVGLLRTSTAVLTADLELKQLRPAASALKLRLEEIETQVDGKGLEAAFQTAKQKQVEAIMTTSVRSFFGERKGIVDLATKYRLPAIYYQKDFVDDGGLMSYGVDFNDLYRRAAHYVDKILKGAKPADLPVQQATQFEFVINLKAAKQIGVTIPQKVLSRADRVIR